MSGSGRKSTYRKGVTHQVLYGTPEPKDNESIVRVIQLRGSNHFEVENAQGIKSLTMLPTKFRKLIWVKKGDFLIVSSGELTAEPPVAASTAPVSATATGQESSSGGSSGVTSIIEHILKKDQIRHLKQKKLWPIEFEETKPTSNKWSNEMQEEADQQQEEEEEEEVNKEGEKGGEEAEGEEEEEEQDKGPKPAADRGIQMVSNDMYFVNRNRPKGYFEEEEEEDSEEED